MSNAVQQNVAAEPALPLFYKNPVAVEPARHATAGLRERDSFSFARETNAIALTGSELALAARTYPIVFSAQAPTLPFAVVGLRDRDNLFVDEQGRWREGCYIPAYVRRYPFIFSEVPNSERLVLCVDEAAENFEALSTKPWFMDGKPGEALQSALKFGETFQAHFEDTKRFGEWLDRNDMLENKVARAELGDGRTFTLQGFRLLNPDRLRALADAQVLELHRRGWLPLLHFHLQSLQNWGVLNALMRAAGR